jgi:alternate signal-mediated exported protein
MNKMTKGAIAGAAGIVLLLGGAGTFALWSDNAGVDGGTITSGVLDLQANTDGVWKDTSSDVSGAPVVVPATFRVVPGDQLTYTQTVTVTATGDNLKAHFGYSLSGGDTLPTGVTAAVTVKQGATILGPSVVVPLGTTTYTVTVVFNFASTIGDGAGHGQDLQNTTFNLDDVALTLQQDARS